MDFISTKARRFIDSIVRDGLAGDELDADSEVNGKKLDCVVAAIGGMQKTLCGMYLKGALERQEPLQVPTTDA